MARGRIVVLGDDKLKAALAAVMPKIRLRVLRKAMRQGAKLAARRAKANARTAFTSRSGLVYRAIRGDVTGGKRGKDPIARVRVKPSVSGIYQGRKRRPSAYAHLVQYGTKHSKAKPFMMDAFDDPAIFEAIKRTAQIEFKKQMRDRFLGV